MFNDQEDFLDIQRSPGRKPLKYRKPRRILSNGMTRSGSTWLFHIVKHVCLQDSLRVAAAWIDDFPQDSYNCEKSFHDYIVIKTHGAPAQRLKQFEYVFTCYRDLRDVVASLVTLRWVAPGVEPIQSLCRQYIEDLSIVEEHGAVSFKYEDMMQNKRGTAERVASVLGLTVDLDKALVDAAWDKQQIHPGHRKLGGGHHFEKHLTKRQIAAIMLVAEGWLKERKYI